MIQIKVQYSTVVLFTVAHIFYSFYISPTQNVNKECTTLIPLVYKSTAHSGWNINNTQHWVCLFSLKQLNCYFFVNKDLKSLMFLSYIFLKLQYTVHKFIKGGRGGCTVHTVTQPPLPPRWLLDWCSPRYRYEAQYRKSSFLNGVRPFCQYYSFVKKYNIFYILLKSLYFLKLKSTQRYRLRYGNSEFLFNTLRFSTRSWNPFICPFANMTWPTVSVRSTLKHDLSRRKQMESLLKLDYVLKYTFGDI